MTPNLILIGGGGHCHSCIDVIEQEGKHQIFGILDMPEMVGGKIMDYPIIGTDNDIPKYAEQGFGFLITVGQIKTAEKRKKLYQLVKKAGGKLPVIISPLAYVSKHSIIGEGTIVMHQSLINANARVGNNCIINTKALVEHDAVIGDHCHISTATLINGNVKVGEGVFFGSGAVSVQGSMVPDGSFVRANCLYYRK